MKNKEKVLDFKGVIKDIEKKRKSFLYRKYSKYVVDYKIEGDYIRVFSNVGRSRKIKNTRSNMSKLNQTIVKNKIAIANKIDEYENSSKERLVVLIINMLLVCGSGAIVPFTFFIGSYLLFLLAIILFSICVLTTSIIGMDYYVLVNEIQNLKNITGYKRDMEFKLPKIDLSQLKNR